VNYLIKITNRHHAKGVEKSNRNNKYNTMLSNYWENTIHIAIDSRLFQETSKTDFVYENLY